MYSRFFVRAAVLVISYRCTSQLTIIPHALSIQSKAIICKNITLKPLPQMDPPTQEVVALTPTPLFTSTTIFRPAPVSYQQKIHFEDFKHKLTKRKCLPVHPVSGAHALDGD